MSMLEKILGGIKSAGRFVDRPAQLANQRDAQINEQIRLSIMENDPELYRILYLPQITDEERRRADEEWYNNGGWQTNPEYLRPQKPSVEQIMRQLDGYYDYGPQGPSDGSGFGA
jgi:hypothetical protein